ncbi:hypothetical protein [Streptomyces sp. MAA16]|uniref:hypothetical protein n=1 Tax=Streptomyces sp. MAA16 TaxID=3035116 RepID=UPI0024759F3B|nr:hypothetical protein [Streptomyces sp. MAA16]MDH6700429.1 hypothetical protein [Streptomyces sp. MAA16]
MPERRKSPARLAAKAADRIRSFNHGTQDAAAYPYPGDVDDAVQALVLLAVRLPQAIEQTGSALAHMHRAGNVRLDVMGDAVPLDEHMDASAQVTAEAVRAAAALEAALRKLGARTCRLAWSESAESAA